jgi:hypothetical protein
LAPKRTLVAFESGPFEVPAFEDQKDRHAKNCISSVAVPRFPVKAHASRLSRDPVRGNFGGVFFTESGS